MFVRMFRPARFVLALIVVLACVRAAVAQVALDDASATALRFEALRTQPEALAAFVAAMPKGADLHNHAGGAVAPADFLAWALADGACYVPATLVLVDPCTGGAVSLGDGVARDPELGESLVDAFSMTGFLARTLRDGHDHFFATFDKFGAVADRHADRLVAAATRDAARSGVLHLELMQNVGSVGAVVAQAGKFDPNDFAADDAALDRAGFAAVVARARDEASAMERGRRALLGCDGPRPEDACAVDVRYLYQMIRVATPASVFAQAKLGFALASSGDAPGGYAGINIVAPEDDPIAVRDDALHMRMIAYFHRKQPAVHIALHAGELTPLLVGPDALRDHIRSAVEIGAAERIGHGVDVLGERDAPQLLAEMAQRDVLVEICLTSNDVILGVRGAAHPLQAYLAAGVPVALATDDPGVSGTTLTKEYLRAATTYGFDYRALKSFAYASIRHAFVPRAHKTALERRLDVAFAAFEAREAHGGP
jgi:hypothetical protein